MNHMNVYHVMKLALIASQLSGYDIPPKTQLPQVIEFNIVEMRDWACPAEAEPTKCRIWGQYNDNDVILVDAEASNLGDNESPSEDSVVVHEMVHWLQDHHGKRGFLCPGIKDRETEAYKAQNLYIQKYERRKLSFAAPESLCEVQEITQP